MNYTQLWSSLGYSLLRSGLLVEMLLVKAVEDLAGAVQSGCAALRESGQRQLSQLPGAVE